MHYHYLKGLMYCDRCTQNGRASRMIFTKAEGRRGDYYDYFACRVRLEGKGQCDLPYLPAAQVEWHVADHYVRLGLPHDFREAITEAVGATLDNEQANLREIHAGYRKQLDRLAVREEKLLDLAEDSALPREKINARLRQIQIERVAAEEGMQETGDKISVGATVLDRHLRLLDDPHPTYATAPDAVRRD